MRVDAETRTGRCLAAALTLTAALGTLFQPLPALAAQQVYEYRIEHPEYGDIGTYTNIVTRRGDATVVTTALHVAVKFLGIVVYRQEAQRTEQWQGDRFVGFEGITTTNGDKLEVHGQAEGDHFVITSPRGTVTAPADIHPSNPWSLEVLNSDLMMSTRSGQIFDVRVSDKKEDTVKFDGVPQKVYRYDIFTDKHQVVWVDARGVTVAFRSMEKGTPVNFVLRESSTAALEPR